MCKKILIISTMLLAACSNETGQLQQQKKELQTEIKTINEKISDEKTKNISNNNTLSALNKELEMNNGNSSSVSNENYADYFNTYTQAMTDAFSEYSAIDTKAAELKEDPVTEEQLKAIQTKVTDASETFNEQLKDKTIPQSYSDIHSQITSADKEFVFGMNKVVKAYTQSDQPLFDEGSAELNEGINKIDHIQFQ